MKHLSKKVKQLRKASGLSQQAFADSIGCSQVTVSHIESRGVADIKTITAIVRKYGISFNALLDDREEINSNDALRKENATLREQVTMLKEMLELMKERKRKAA